MSRSRQILLGLTVIVVFLAAVVALALNNRTDAPAAGSASEKAVTISASDGVQLAALQFSPKKPAGAPLVVMPAAWGRTASMYRPIARQFAKAGYLVVAYTQRGFEGSGGKVDLAGTGTQSDVSAVIDWALRTTRASKQQVGAFGISYGAGVSLLAAAKDKRIRAVVALSTWTDLAASFNPNGTPSARAIATLFASGSAEKQLDATSLALRDQLAKQPARVGSLIDRISPERSAGTYVSQLNANKTAILLANGFQDSLFPPGPLITFFDRLTTAKRLQLAPGEHAVPEGSALQGRQNTTVNDGQAWLDHYLRGTDNQIDTDDPVILTDGATGAVHTYPRWPATSARDVVRLGVPGSKKQTGAGIAAAWKATIGVGPDSVASSASPQASLVDLSRLLAFAWTGPAVDQPTLLTGVPELRLQLSATKTTGTLVAYLYDVDDKGVGKLVTLQPYSFANRAAGSTNPVRLSLQPMSWTLASGHRFVVVVDTQDPRWTSLNPSGARITASSSTTTPAELVIRQG